MIVRVSIDIAEKYKTTVLGDHRQEKKEKKRKKDSPSWIGTSTRGTPQLNSLGELHTSTLTRLDWGMNMSRHSKLHGHDS